MRIYIHDRITNWRVLRRLAIILGAVRPEAPYATCPRCGTDRLDRLKRIDEIDRVSKLPWSALQRFLGGKLYHCRSCRLQFHDCRKQLPPAGRTG